MRHVKQLEMYLFIVPFGGSDCCMCICLFFLVGLRLGKRLGLDLGLFSFYWTAEYRAMGRMGARERERHADGSCDWIGTADLAAHNEHVEGALADYAADTPPPPSSICTELFTKDQTRAP
ncbi:hypothetical protein SKAU_G00344590 [Synaphobranchus kaupii]|uniref:Uncharacterized protein n=1 Tax=Synaphobranchus kaupii TaxID=118154 RepID=A0A9Q1IHK1_SYNKA|nr:hypothetical protein SKAU_G00344590 [Synaphobranchus kaupii]